MKNQSLWCPLRGGGLICLAQWEPVFTVGALHEAPAARRRDLMKGIVGCGQDMILPVGRDDSARRYPVAVMINGIVGCGWLMIPLAIHPTFGGGRYLGIGPPEASAPTVGGRYCFPSTRPGWLSLPGPGRFVNCPYGTGTGGFLCRGAS